jgi:hypothetical protein
VHHRVEAREVLGAHVAHVHGDRLDLRHLAEGALAVEVAVEPDHLVPGGGEQRRQDGADVTVVAGDENSHGRMAPVCGDRG